MIEELASGTKYSQNLSFKMTRVSLLPSARKLPNAGFEDSHWDGPMPFITGDTEVLLVDNGPEAEEHQWMPVGQLLYVVVRFWLEFFERCSGGTTRGLNNRGAAGVGG
jgi:hypothetical protein